MRFWRCCACVCVCVGGDGGWFSRAKCEPVSKGEKHCESVRWRRNGGGGGGLRCVVCGGREEKRSKASRITAARPLLAVSFLSLLPPPTHTTSPRISAARTHLESPTMMILSRALVRCDMVNSLCPHVVCHGPPPGVDREPPHHQKPSIYQ